MTGRRLGFFTRLLDGGAGPGRYGLALEQFEAAEDLGFDVGWVAQHHLDPEDGGLPSPLVFLAAAAARTRRLRLATGIITLAIEQPLRMAEDAAVLDALSSGRLELGFGTGGSGTAFDAFGVDEGGRSATYAAHLETVLEALSGKPLTGGAALFPDGSRLLDDLWQATFSVAGGSRAGRAGHGLLLSRTQPREDDRPEAALDELQLPIVDAYRAALPPSARPRIGVSRGIFVGTDRSAVLAAARAGVQRQADHLLAVGVPLPSLSADGYLQLFDVHAGTPDDVIASLSADRIVALGTDLIAQVHPCDPGPAATLESMRLIATEVAPVLGYGR